MPDEGRGRESPGSAAAEGEKFRKEPNLSGKRTAGRRGVLESSILGIDADGVILSGLGQGEPIQRSPN